MVKRKGILTLLLCLLAVCVLAFTACGKGGEASTSGSSDSDSKTTATDAGADTGKDSAHIHDYVFEKTVDATCTEDGYDIYKCACGDEKREANDKKATGHSYDYDEIKYAVTKAEIGENDLIVTATATLKCEKCDAKLTEPANYESIEDITMNGDNECESDVTVKLQLSYTDKLGDKHTGYATTEIAASGHKYGDLHAAVAVTCEQDGNVAYYQCSVCREYFDENKKAISADDIFLKATGHDYVCTYAWNTENLDDVTCTATAVCSHNAQHTITENYRVGKVSNNATCERADDERVYAYFNDDNFETQYKEIHFDALGHEWQQVKVSWEKFDAVCSASAYCDRCKSWEYETAALTEKVVQGYEICEKDEKTQYTATFTKEPFKNIGADELTKIYVTRNAGYHIYDSWQYTWNDDYTACTAKRVCLRSEKHVETEVGTVETTKVYSKQSCETDEVVDVTATFKNAGSQTQRRVTVKTRTGHDFDYENGTMTLGSVTAYLTATCKNGCDKTSKLNTKDFTAELTKDPTCKEEGAKRVVAKFSIDGNEKTIEKTISVRKHGHQLKALDNGADGAICRVCNTAVPVSNLVFVADNAENPAYYIVKGFADGLTSAEKENLVVPATYEGLPVKYIAASSLSGKTYGAFQNERDILSIFFPEGLITWTSPQSAVFTGCENVEFVTLPTTFVYTSDYTNDGTNFYGLNSLKGVFIESLESWIKTTWLTSPFQCSNEAYLYLNGNILTKVVIPDTVETIYKQAFYNIKGITDVTFGKNVTTVKEMAFQSMFDLENIELSDKIETWNSYVTLTKKLNASVDGGGGYYIGSATNEYLVMIGCTESQTIKISDDTVIVACSFSGNKNLLSLTVGSKVNRFTYGSSNSLRKYCLKLVEVIDKSPKKIMNNSEVYNKLLRYTDSGTSQLGYANPVVLLTGNTARTKDSEGKYRTYIVDFDITKNTHKQGNDVYETPLISPAMKSKYRIGDYAFYNQNGLTKVIISASVDYIGEYAFANCNNLKTVSTTCTLATGDAANGSDITIKDYAFSGCHALTSIEFGKNTTIGNYAFQDCDKLSSLDLTKVTGKIGFGAFEGCYRMPSVITIPDGVTSIGYKAFPDCKEIVFLGATEIDKNSFENVLKITITPDAVITKSSSDFNDVTVNFIGTTEEWFAFDKSAFSYYDLYFNGKPLTKIEITGMDVPARAFATCNNLVSVVLGNGVTSIGDYAFDYSVQRLEIGADVTTIGKKAFCSGLVIFRGSKPITIGTNNKCYAIINENGIDVSAVKATATVDATPEWVIVEGDFVLQKSNNNYVLVKYTGNAANLVLPATIGGHTYDIGYSAFANNTTLVSVTINGNSKTIDNYAFDGCHNLKTVIISEGVESLGYDVFCGTQVKSLTLPATLTSVDYYSWGDIQEVVTPDEDLCEQICDATYEGFAKTKSAIVKVGDYMFITRTGVEKVNYLIGYEGDSKNLVLPADFNGETYTVDQSAFRYSDIESIEFPDNITLSERMFVGCTDLKYIKVGKVNGTVYNFFARSSDSDTKYMQRVVYVVLDKSITEIKFDTNGSSVPSYYLYDCTKEEHIAAGGSSMDLCYGENGAGDWYYDENGEITLWKDPSA